MNAAYWNGIADAKKLRNAAKGRRRQMEDKLLVHGDAVYFIRGDVNVEGKKVDEIHHLSYRAAHVNKAPALPKMAVGGVAGEWALYV